MSDMIGFIATSNFNAHMRYVLPPNGTIWQAHAHTHTQKALMYWYVYVYRAIKLSNILRLQTLI